MTIEGISFLFYTLPDKLNFVSITALQETMTLALESSSVTPRVLGGRRWLLTWASAPLKYGRSQPYPLEGGKDEMDCTDLAEIIMLFTEHPGC